MSVVENEPSTNGPRRVAVTGIGCVTPIGTGVEEFWAGLRRGKSVIRKLDRFDPSPFRSQIAATVDGFDASDYMDAARVKRLDRFSHFAVAASRLALDDSGLDLAGEDLDRVGIQMGSALGGIAYAEEQMGRYVANGVRGVSPMLALTVFTGAASCNVAIEFGITGPNSTNAMSCASGAIAIGEGMRLVRSGEADVVLAGGVEAPLKPLCYGAFAIIRAMSTRNDDPAHASRPFDADRDGFVMAEGGSVLVLEEMGRACARGARIYGELLGYANTSDASHMTAPRTDGVQAARAMRLALKSAGVTPDEVDYVNAHGSSTPLNDSTESRVIRSVLGPRAHEVPVNGTKGFHGHALGATGAFEAAATLLTLQRGWIPPTLNLEQPGDECDLAYVRGEGDTRRVDCAVSNSFGFGGINAALVIGRYPDGNGAHGAGNGAPHERVEHSSASSAIKDHRTGSSEAEPRRI